MQKHVPPSFLEPELCHYLLKAQIRPERQHCRSELDDQPANDAVAGRDAVELAPPQLAEEPVEP